MKLSKKLKENYNSLRKDFKEEYRMLKEIHKEEWKITGKMLGTCALIGFAAGLDSYYLMDYIGQYPESTRTVISYGLGIISPCLIYDSAEEYFFNKIDYDKIYGDKC